MRFGTLVFGWGLLALGPVVGKSIRRAARRVVGHPTSYAVDYPAALHRWPTTTSTPRAKSGGSPPSASARPTQTICRGPWSPTSCNRPTKRVSRLYVAGRRRYKGVQEFFTEQANSPGARSARRSTSPRRKSATSTCPGRSTSRSRRGSISSSKSATGARRGHDPHRALPRSARQGATPPPSKTGRQSAPPVHHNVRTTELKAKALRLLDESSQIKKTLDRSIADEGHSKPRVATPPPIKRPRTSASPR